MKINRDSEKGHHYMNDLNVVIRPDGNHGVGDSLGRTARAMVLYDEDSFELFQGVKSYFKFANTSPEAGEQLYVLRYPVGIENAVVGNSRDHVVIMGSCTKQLGYVGFLKMFIEERAKRPSINTAYSIGQRIWFKALFSKFWSWVYLLWVTPGLLTKALRNWVFRYTGGLRKTWDSPEEFIKADVKPTKWQKFLVSSELIFPGYASFYTLYEIIALESKWAKWIMQKVMLLHFEKSNYVARAMCGQKVEYPEGYRPSRKNRWSIRLDRACNRDMRAYDDNESENLEMGMLKYYCNGI